MRIDAIREKVDGIPFMGYDQATMMTDFIFEHGARDILEIGCMHGVSTCYMAGAVQELGGGHVTTIDIADARHYEPNVEELLTRVGLRDLVTVYYEPTSYTWRLMKMLEENPEPRFDFCYIDGPHNWFVDGFGFFLVDRVLRPDGWIIFDDIHWSYAASPDPANQAREMPKEERETQQIRKVYDLLVKPHPCYADLMIKDTWAYAHKIASDPRSASAAVKTEIIYEEGPRYIGVGAAMLRVGKKVARKLGLASS